MFNRDWLLLLMLWSLAFLVGCGKASVETWKTESGMPPPDSGPTSLEEGILKSDVVARVRLISAGGAVVRPPGVSNKFVSALEFRFQVLEYLKGSGGSEVVAFAIEDFRYDTDAEARATVPDVVAARDTRWDNREAIVFLQSYEQNQSPRYVIGRYSVLEDDYTVASRHEKNWLPEAATTTSALSRSTDTAEKRFLLDAPSDVGATGLRSVGRTESAPTITLSAIKTSIAELEREIAAGDGSEEYLACVLAARPRNTVGEWLGV